MWPGTRRMGMAYSNALTLLILNSSMRVQTSFGHKSVWFLEAAKAAMSWTDLLLVTPWQGQQIRQGRHFPLVSSR